jgi:renalase
VTVIVVGAGIAGLSCARELVDAGVPARVVERGRVVGGRLASKRIDGRYADIGAAYLTADDPGFRGLLDTWRVAGLAHPWTDTFAVHEDGKVSSATGPTRWAAPGGLRSLAEDLARELDVTLEHEVRELPSPADAVVLAMPGPQAARITDLGVPQEWSPVLAAVLTFAERGWDDFDGMFVNGHDVLATVCDDGSRRGDGAPVLVAHSTPDFARPYLDRPADAGGAMEKAVRDLLGVPSADVRMHRWTFAQPAPVDGGHFARKGNVYLCGDAFGKPRVQTAWLSGRAVAHDILQSSER